jgi:hypothetical protein
MPKKQKAFFYVDESQNLWGCIYEHDPKECQLDDAIDWRNLIGAKITDIKVSNDGLMVFFVELAEEPE